jgi:hypothetical protein
MSRIYTIQVSERVRRVIHLEDRASTQLELIEVLPAEAMRELLQAELLRRGFTVTDSGVAHRIDDRDVVIEIEVASGTVTISLAREQTIAVAGDAKGRSANEHDRALANLLRNKLEQDLECQIDQQAEQEQTELTRELEKHLRDIGAELDAIGHRVTAEALTRKAAQLGEIESIQQAADGSLTIRVKV